MPNQLLFYITKEDPDYSIKGSRDPLGFQVIWQQQAKQLIPYLSTVSINLRDFQILNLAYFFYGSDPDAKFASYFIRFEQLMAFARKTMGDDRFNGIEQVSKRLSTDTKSVVISNSKMNQILANQRTYGIWGKYNRPHRDIGFTRQAEFGPIYSQKIGQLKDRFSLERLIQKVQTKEEFRVSVDELALIHPLLQYTHEERLFYERMILMVNQPNPLQNEIYAFLKENKIPETFSIGFLQSLKADLSAKNDLLYNVLTEIEETEKILCPLNRIFRYLQTKPVWIRDAIQNDRYLLHCKNELGYSFLTNSESNKLKNSLSLSLAKPNWELIQDLVKRNTEVMSWRGGVQWLRINGEVLEIHHTDGGFYDPKFDPINDHDNDYFMNCYISLFKQITQS